MTTQGFSFISAMAMDAGHDEEQGLKAVWDANTRLNGQGAATARKRLVFIAPVDGTVRWDEPVAAHEAFQGGLTLPVPMRTVLLFLSRYFRHRGLRFSGP
jgi:hypothetical protein